MLDATSGFTDVCASPLDSVAFRRINVDAVSTSPFVSAFSVATAEPERERFGDERQTVPRVSRRGF
jgi:hypothetical protein